MRADVRFVEPQKMGNIYILYVQIVITHFIYSKLQYKMDKKFFDIQYKR